VFYKESKQIRYIDKLTPLKSLKDNDLVIFTSQIFKTSSLIFETKSLLTKNLKHHIIRPMRQKIVLYDEKTGKVLDEYDKAVFIGHKPKIDKGFVKVFVAFFRDVLENERLGKGAWRLLLYVIDNLNYNKLEVYLVPEKVMRDLAITKATYYRWLKVLLEEGFLEKLATNIYRLRPFMVVKGQMTKAIEFDF
jgi:hypothetical protein